MSVKKDYLVAIEGNEALLERYIAAINDDTCKVAVKYPNPYLLETGEEFLNSRVIEYFFRTTPLSKTVYIDFFEKLRKLEPSGFNGYSYSLKEWIESRIIKKFYEVETDEYDRVTRKTLKKDIVLSEDEKEILSFICYVAVCHIKYGASYETITANEYFDLVTELGSDEVPKLKKVGTGNLPDSVIAHKDNDLICKANDVFATIKIKIIEDHEQAYKKALTFVNTLLKTDFPRSYVITFSSKNKSTLPIKGLPKCGQNYLFAGAVKYPNLHQDIKTYISLAQKEFEWYNNLEDEHCATPGTFAAFALGMDSEAYFDTIIEYFQNVDDEHQMIQEKYSVALIEKFGLTAKSIQVYINCILSMQSHSHKKLFIKYFSTEVALKLLLDSKEHFEAYYFTPKDLEEFSDEEEKADMIKYYWDYIMHTTFGQDLNRVAKKLSEEEKAIFDQLQP